MSGRPSDVIVIGGGVVGSSITYHLAKRDIKTTLVEQWDIAAAASGASAGGVRQQGRDLREMPLAIAAIARWEHLEAELDADIHYYRNGHLKVIEDEADLPVLEAEVAKQRDAGLEITVVAHDTMRELVPGLGPHVIAGTYTTNDGHANPGLTARAFANAAARYGADVRTQTRVTGLAETGGRLTGVSTDQGELAADWVVLATGAWSNDVLRGIGIEAPTRPVGLQMILTTARPAFLRQVVGSIRRPLSLKQLRAGNYLIGGGWPGDVDLRLPRGTIRPESITGSRTTAAAIFPPLTETDIADTWVGIEAFAPDNVPILGPIPGVENLTVAFGFSGHGFALSPITGQVISELVIDGRSSLSLEAFNYARFAGKESEQWLPTPHAG
ncbi:MAG: FAD-binding oxidoreductase [Chloroflexota bacterium]|nr:FAD-binding oxidoreductase [Chloroflexota bacterium]